MGVTEIIGVLGGAALILKLLTYNGSRPEVHKHEGALAFAFAVVIGVVAIHSLIIGAVITAVVDGILFLFWILVLMELTSIETVGKDGGEYDKILLFYGYNEPRILYSLNDRTYTSIEYTDEDEPEDLSDTGGNVEV